ncbi:cell surface glycoprotein (s-layer protein)-like protein [Anaeramoeba ignava]|uniref:Cell surface glycoprotein (S-layer protein)-like protein n=1 Tax=Anaeramoeba ignava TaxID=1746090 RepID=A0A9Q0LKB8_ANAIG|nr:cell surface glycoprotein (s-layer protein)-like protein [Anaeramoeba ignava]
MKTLTILLIVFGSAFIIFASDIDIFFLQQTKFETKFETNLTKEIFNSFSINLSKNDQNKLHKKISYSKIPILILSNEDKLTNYPNTKYIARNVGRGKTTVYFTTESIDFFTKNYLIKLKMEEGNLEEVEAIGKGTLDTKITSMIGKDESQWKHDIKSYSGIVYRNVYKDVDLYFSVSKNGNLKSEFLVRNGNYEQIRTRYEMQTKNSGENQIKKDQNNGEIFYRDGCSEEEEISRCQFEFREKAPLIYQNGREIEGQYKVEKNVVSYLIEGDLLEKNKAILIDPEFSIYVGGSDEDEGMAAAIDVDGNIYLAGKTFSADFPVTSGAYSETLSGNSDGFLAKINSTGNGISWATFIGSDDEDQIVAVKLDSSGYPVVAGTTNMANGPSPFPTTSGAIITHCDANVTGFVTKFNLDGSALEWSSFLCADTSANINDLVLVNDYPVVVGKVFITKFTTDGSDFSAVNCFGGSDNDVANAITLTSAGNLVVSGSTNSADFPIINNGYNSRGTDTDCFVAKLSGSDLTTIFTSALGGNGFDYALDVATDIYENIYVSGSTKSDNLPATADAYQQAFSDNLNLFSGLVFKLSYNGIRLIYLSYLYGNFSQGQSFSSTSIATTTDLVYISGHGDCFSQYTDSYNFFNASATNTTAKGYIAVFDQVFFSLVDTVQLSEFFSSMNAYSSNGILVTGSTTDSLNATSGPFGEYFGGVFDSFIIRISPCDKGSYRPNAFSFCELCAVGTYKDSVGNNQCTDCIAGTYNPNLGSISADNCSLCPPGRVNPNTAASSLDNCLYCQRFYYAPDPGLTQCLACDSDQFSSISRTHCIDKLNASSFIHFGLSSLLFALFFLLFFVF